MTVTLVNETEVITLTTIVVAVSVVLVFLGASVSYRIRKDNVSVRILRTIWETDYIN